MREDDDQELRQHFQAMRQADASAAPAWPEDLLRSSPRPAARPAGQLLWQRRLAMMVLLAVLCGVVAMFARPAKPRPDLARQLPSLFDGPATPIFDPILVRPTETPVAVATNPASAASPWTIQTPSDAFLNLSPRVELFR